MLLLADNVIAGMDMQWVSGGYGYFFVKSFEAWWGMGQICQNVCKIHTALVLSLPYEIMAYLYI